MPKIGFVKRYELIVKLGVKIIDINQTSINNEFHASHPIMEIIQQFSYDFTYRYAILKVNLKVLSIVQLYNSLCE